MNEVLNFNVGRNYFHTLKEHSITVEGQIIIGSATVTGFTKQPLEIGGWINIQKQKYQITEIVERRNHAGVFNNPEDKINSFFKIETKYETIITPKK